LLVGTVKGLYQVDISDLPGMFERPDIAFKNQALIADLNVWRIINEGEKLDLATNKGLFKFDLNSKELVKNTRITQSIGSLLKPMVHFICLIIPITLAI